MISNMSRYIIRLTDRLWCLYYDEFDGICFREYINNHWTNPYTIYKDTNKYFSVTLSDMQQLYLFCQTKTGQIVLCNYSGKEWRTKVLKERSLDLKENIYISAILNENNNINLLYNLPDDTGKRHYLNYTTISKDTTWSIPDTIDEIWAVNVYPYILQKITNGHYIVYYQTKNKDNLLGYREISSTQNIIGDYKTICSTAYQVTEVAFLTTTTAIHSLYVVLNMFSQQLIYKKKDGIEFSKPITIFESQRIENISIFILENQIWIAFYSNGVLYTAISNGKAFSRPQRFRRTFNESSYKAMYLTNIEQNENEIYLSTIYTAEDITDILLIPDIYPDFYPQAIVHKKQQPKQIESSNMHNSEDFNILRNKLSQALEDVKSKDRQLIEMAQILKERNENINYMEEQWRRKIKELTEENIKLKIDSSSETS